MKALKVLAVAILGLVFLLFLLAAFSGQQEKPVTKQDIHDTNVEVCSERVREQVEDGTISATSPGELQLVKLVAVADCVAREDAKDGIGADDLEVPTKSAVKKAPPKKRQSSKKELEAETQKLEAEAQSWHSQSGCESDGFVWHDNGCHAK